MQERGSLIVDSLQAGGKPLPPVSVNPCSKRSMLVHKSRGAASAAEGHCG